MMHNKVNIQFLQKQMEKALKDNYSKLITNTIKELNKFAKLVHSTSEENQRAVEVVFARMPFKMNF